MNKIDMLLDTGRKWEEKSAIDYLSGRVGEGQDDKVLISAERKWGLSKLLELKGSNLDNTGKL